jgi:hypothetical protein
MFQTKMATVGLGRYEVAKNPSLEIAGDFFVFLLDLEADISYHFTYG